jgi:flagellar basal body rod protein FlgC
VNEFALLDAAARGMTAQRTILDLAARNVAAAQAAVPGHAYDRLVATLRPAAPDDVEDIGAFPVGDPPFATDDANRADGANDADGDEGTEAVPLTITRAAGTGDALTELIAVLDAQRAYEANASIFDTGKRLAERTLEIER